MKDLVITTHRQKNELYTLLICFIIANAVNLYAIISHNAAFSELLTSFFYILTFTVVLYVIWTFIRIVYYSFKFIIKKK